MSQEINIILERGNPKDISVELGKVENYEKLSNKPRINGVELVGNKTPEDLGIEMPDVSGFATKEELDQKQPKGDYALKSELPVIPTKVSAFENDKGYLTEHQDISGLATKQELAAKQDKLTAGNGISIENNEIKNTGILSATYDAENENLVLVGG